MTRHLLNSGLARSFEVFHYNISKGRPVNTKAEFDLINIIFGLAQPCKLIYLLIRHRPEIVYTNLAQTNAGFLRYASFIVPCFLARCRIVARVMGDGFTSFYRRCPFKWVVRVVVSMVDRFVVRAEALRAQFENLVPSEKVRVVYSGIPVEEFDRPDLKRPRDDKIRVLFVGLLSQAKGAFDVLRAVPGIVTKRNNVIFQLMGPRIGQERNITYVPGASGFQDETLGNITSDPLVKRYTELLGVQTGDEKVESFLNADIFLFPSYSEAFPTVVLEAMAAGLAVVATPVGVLPEVFSESNMLFVTAGDIEGMTAAVLKLAGDRVLREEMGRFNRLCVEKCFGLEQYGKRIEAVLHELTDGSNLT